MSTAVQSRPSSFLSTISWTREKAKEGAWWGLKKAVLLPTKFGIGIAGGIYICPYFQNLFLQLAQSMGMIAKLDQVDNLTLFREITNIQDPTDEQIKTFLIIASIVVPLIEELFFRGIIQDFILKRVPNFLLKKMRPIKSIFSDSTRAKICRVALTTGLFSAFHLLSIGSASSELKSFMQIQAIGAIPLGLFFGAIKESPLGLFGTIGAHMGHNFVAMMESISLNDSEQ